MASASAPSTPLEFLNRELAQSDEVGNYLDMLSLSREVRGLEQRCPQCCHWSLPLNAPFRGRNLPSGAAMLFQEWIIYHIHVVLHQRLHERQVLAS